VDSPVRSASETQPQRTTLAAQRTGLSLLVGSLLLARLISDELGPWAALVPAVVVVLLGIAAVSDRRLTSNPPAVGVRTACLSAGVVVLAVAELAALVR